MLHYMMDMLDYLGWQIGDDCSVATQTGRHVDLVNQNKEQILQSVAEAWFQDVAGKVATKDGLCNVNTVDLAISQAVITSAFTTKAAVHSRQKRKFLAPQQAVCKNLQSGGYTTAPFA